MFVCMWLGFRFGLNLMNRCWVNSGVHKGCEDDA